MAGPSPYSPGAPLKDGSSESAQVADNASYNDGVLAWNGAQLKDEDIITATRTKSNEGTLEAGYTIWSLEPLDASKPAPPTPFKLGTTSASTLPKPFLDKHLFQGLSAHLNHEANSIHILISTLSGTGLAPQFFDEILKPLLHAIGLKESDYSVVRTKSAESVKEFAQSQLLVRANAGKKQTVLMLSGDGGIVDTINGLLETGDRSKYISNLLTSSLVLIN
jgi:hypothetical protein